MTRALLSVLRLDFTAALAYHPLFFLTPLMLLYFLFDGRLFKKSIDAVLIALIAAAFVLVWILRLAGTIPCP